MERDGTSNLFDVYDLDRRILDRLQLRQEFQMTCPNSNDNIPRCRHGELLHYFIDGVQHKNYCAHCVASESKAEADRARREAFEEAAKIADAHYGSGGSADYYDSACADIMSALEKKAAAIPAQPAPANITMPSCTHGALDHIGEVTEKVSPDLGALKDAFIAMTIKYLDPHNERMILFPSLCRARDAYLDAEKAAREGK